ncbi:hypothetical protein Q5H92_25785, partial [Hymenobacter sp. M29]
MNTKTIAWGGLLALAFPITGLAQDTAQPPLPRWFVGVGGAWGTFQEPARLAQHEGYGPAVTAGRYLTPRLAVQVGLVFYQRLDFYGFNGTYDAAHFNPGGTLLTQIESNTERRRAFTVPVLLRYGLTRNPTAGWQFDVLAGGAWLQTQRLAVNEVENITTAGTTFRRSEYSETFTGANLTAGLGLHRTLSRHLELTLDALGHLSLTPREPLFQNRIAYYLYSQPVPPLADRLTGTVLLGLRYRFGPSGSALPLPAATLREPWRPRWFAGLGAGFGRYQLQRDESGRRVLSPVPSVGVQLSPYLAVQLSAVYGQDRSHSIYAYGRTFPTGRRSAAYDLRDTRLRTLALPLLVRYGLIANTEQPWQVELLAGATAVRSTFERTVATADDTGTVYPELAAEESRAATNLL